MIKRKMSSNSEKIKTENDAGSHEDSLIGVGGELHQMAGGDHPAHSTHQGVGGWSVRDDNGTLNVHSKDFTDYRLTEEIELNVSDSQHDQ